MTKDFSVCIGPETYYSHIFTILTTNKLEDLYKSEESILPIVSLIPLPKNSQLKGIY